MALSSLATEYRVPKREISAEASFLGNAHRNKLIRLLLGHPRKEVRLFLNERAQSREGAERPSDLLNGPGEFLPTLESSRKVVLLQKDALLVLSVAAEAEFPSQDDAAGVAGAAVSVEVVLQDATEIRGVVRFAMPEGRSRLVDFLNLPERFLAIREGNRARLVNKRAIVRVSIIGQEPGK
jgi:hypothetical protein